MPNASSSKYSPTYRARVIERVRAGESMTRIAKSLQVSSGLIYLWAKKEGLTGPGKPVPAADRSDAAPTVEPKKRIRVRDRKRSHHAAPTMEPTFFPPMMNKTQAVLMQKRIEHVQRLAKLVGVDEDVAHMIFVKGGMAAMELQNG